MGIASNKSFDSISTSSPINSKKVRGNRGREKEVEMDKKGKNKIDANNDCLRKNGGANIVELRSNDSRNDHKMGDSDNGVNGLCTNTENSDNDISNIIHSNCESDFVCDGLYVDDEGYGHDSVRTAF